MPFFRDPRTGRFVRVQTRPMTWREVAQGTWRQVAEGEWGDLRAVDTDPIAAAHAEQQAERVAERLKLTRPAEAPPSVATRALLDWPESVAFGAEVVEQIRALHLERATYRSPALHSTLLAFVKSAVDRAAQKLEDTPRSRPGPEDLAGAMGFSTDTYERRLRDLRNGVHVAGEAEPRSLPWRSCSTTRLVDLARDVLAYRKSRRPT